MSTKGKYDRLIVDGVPKKAVVDRISVLAFSVPTCERKCCKTCWICAMSNTGAASKVLYALRYVIQQLTIWNGACNN